MEKFNLLCGVKRVQNCFSGHQHPGLCDLPEPRVGREGVLYVSLVPIRGRLQYQRRSFVTFITLWADYKDN